jgi:2-succinyl-6-hydroxy-2,4-cyclohexadiene-1-carboxylate synthase
VSDLTDASSPRPRLVLAHGFTQTARSWSHFEEILASTLPGTETLAVDLPGHGTAPDLRGDLWKSAEHLIDHGGRATYVGYSMGGRVALHAALAHPGHVDALVLIGATAGLDSASDRQQRRDADELLATRIELIGVSSFIDEWLANPLFASLNDDQALRADRLRNTSEGLAASLRSTGTGTQEPLWDRLAEIDIPVLVIAGERDDKFRTIGRRLADRLPQSTFEIIHDAGHSVHLEQPITTAQVLSDWYLDSIGN